MAVGLPRIPHARHTQYGCIVRVEAPDLQGEAVTTGLPVLAFHMPTVGALRALMLLGAAGGEKSSADIPVAVEDDRPAAGARLR